MAFHRDCQMKSELYSLGFFAIWNQWLSEADGSKPPMLPVHSPTWLLVLLSNNYFLSDICRKNSAYPEWYNLYLSQTCPTEARTCSNHRSNFLGRRLSHIAVFFITKILNITNLQQLQIYNIYLTHIAATSLAKPTTTSNIQYIPYTHRRNITF